MIQRILSGINMHELSGSFEVYNKNTHHTQTRTNAAVSLHRERVVVGSTSPRGGGVRPVDPLFSLFDV